MSKKYARRSGSLLLAAALVVTGATAAHADEDPHGKERHEIEGVDFDFDPALGEDAFITDDMESGLATTPTGVTCSYESVQTAKNAQPTSWTFQHLYVVPYNITPAKHLDVPRSCSDGSVKYSSIAMASRNMMTFLDRQSAGLQYRTANITYTHNFTGSTYSTRGVRRFVSSYSQANWNATKTLYNNTSPRLSKLKTELVNNGWDVPYTKYTAVLDASEVGTCSTTSCSYTVGVAEIGGTYGLTNRSTKNPNTGTVTYLRFGCATSGDSIMAHENTHMVGATHVTDHTHDLMRGSMSSSTFKSSPSKIWDYGRNSYHSTVRSDPAVGLSSLAGNYYVCS